MIQEPARASQTRHVVPREPVAVWISSAHVLARANEDIMNKVKVVRIGYVT